MSNNLLAPDCLEVISEFRKLLAAGEADRYTESTRPLKLSFFSRK